MHLCVCLHLSAGVCGSQKGASDRLELEFQMVVKLSDVGVGI